MAITKKHVPNAATAKAIRDPEDRKVSSFENFDDMLANLRR
jgi:hypothetical protein